jgi:hypothetical protein
VVESVASAASDHVDRSAYGVAVFRVHRVCNHLDFLYGLRTENAKPSGPATLRVIYSINQECAAVQAAKREGGTTELVVAPAVESRSEERQIECVPS